MHIVRGATRHADRLAKFRFGNSEPLRPERHFSEFIDLAQRYNVQGVPKTVINDRVEFTGALPEPRFVQEVLKALQPKPEQ